MNRDDLRMVLNWRNSPYVYNRMLTEHKITWEEHQAWFERIKDEQPSEHLIFCHKDVPVGYIAYFGHKPEDKQCSVGIYLRKLSDNPWDGIFLCVKAIDYAFDNLPIEVIQAETLMDNEPSLSLTRFLGFADIRVDKGMCEKNGEQCDVQILQLKKDDWIEYKKMRGL